MSDFFRPATIVCALNNRIARVEYNAGQSNSATRAFAITKVDGGKTTYTWPVVAPNTAADVDQLFQDLRATHAPYSDLMADAGIVARIVAACQGVGRLNAEERGALDQIADVANMINDKITRAARTNPLTSDPAEKLQRRQHINEAGAMYRQAVEMLNDFMARRRMVVNNVIPLETRTAHAADLARGVQRFGLKALMFDQGLFV